MAESVNRPYKEDQSTVSETPRGSFRDPDAERPVPVRRIMYRRPPSERGVDYTTFKAAFASAVEELKQEIREQHEQTRAQIQTVRRDVLDAIKASPAEYVKLACEFVALFLVFSLAVRFILKIELVNTVFALFLLTALAVYWAMARWKQESDERNHRKSRT
jgi:hypothetical protein